MYFENLSALWHMSGHGVYVWSAYAACAAAFLYLLLQPLQSYRQQLKTLLDEGRAAKKQQSNANNHSETSQHAPD